MTAGGPTIPGTTSRGSTQLKVTVMSVDGPIAVVLDQTGRQLQIRRDLMRAKGYQPQIGEQWFIDKALNNTWTFALCVTSSNSVDTDVSALQGQVVSLQGEVATLQGQVTALQTSNTALQSDATNRAIICTVILSSNAGIGANTDTYAAGGWAATVDPHSMAHLSTSPNPNYIQIPVNGRYRVYFSAVMTSVANSAYASFVTLNSAAATASIARGSLNDVVAGDTRPVADREVFLHTGDQLNWGVYCLNATTLKAISLNVPTELHVRYIAAI